MQKASRSKTTNHKQDDQDLQSGQGLSVNTGISGHIFNIGASLAGFGGKNRGFPYAILGVSLCTS
jgi:hypothetical protein